MLNWFSEGARPHRCPICHHEGDMPWVVDAPRIDRPTLRSHFMRCLGCDSLIHDGAITAFEHSQAGDEHVFLRQYLESTAGLWEMFWPVASLADAPGRSLLEVGCGFGFTADLWRHHIHPDAQGCDPARYAAVGRALLGPHIHPVLLDDAPSLAKRSFDVVYASEVIEHVDDPLAFVLLLAERLSERGVLVLTTPAAEFVAPANDPGTVTAALAAGFHAFLFSAPALERVLRAVGLNEVIVERHNERLIAWASRVRFARQDPMHLFARYLAYLDQRAERVTTNDAATESLMAGLAFRAWKERLLRGLSADLEPARARANRHALEMTTRAHTDASPDPDRLLDAVAALDPGPAAFGRLFRYCLPQMAFLNAIHHERLSDSLTARRWHRLAQAATERLCAPSVLHGLEAASFYWVSESRRLLALLEQADAAGLADGLVRLLAAHETPTTVIGGGAPSAESIGHLLETLADADRSVAYGMFLSDVAARLDGEPVPEPASRAVHAVSRHLQLVSARLCGQPTRAADADFERAIAGVVTRDERLRDRFKHLLERERKRTRPSFAALAKGGWSHAPWR